ncbi:MAG TPA: glycosyltransferase [Pyrinomonadaceae bacterium]|nr:glycosyltransferase [Pyrinomonadaceae bacterium]
MKRVAIVVQRCHESVVGGSETLARQYANLLKDAYEVDVLTTTATDAAYWANVLPEGLEVSDGINIRRFHVDIGYSPYRTEIFTRMLEDFDRLGAGSHQSETGHMRHIPWSIALQEEFVRRIGPYSESLAVYLRENWSQYRSIIFVTYLYPTAYFGLLEVPPGRALFAPTLHDEQPAYLSVYKHAARRAHSMIWLTEAERQIGRDLWGDLPGIVVSMAIDVEPRQPAQRSEPYVLYCGRIDPHKGCDELFDFFIRFKEQHPSPLRLILTGIADVPVPEHPEIDFLGFVPSEEKFSLMAGANAYLMPSKMESFSIVTLEAMGQRTPVLVNGKSNVLADHIRASGGGRMYHDYESFTAGLRGILTTERSRFTDKGRRYVVSRYTPERVRKLLIEAVESCPAPDDYVSRPVPAPSVTRKKTNGQRTSLSPPLPLPEGWSEDQLRALLNSVRLENAPVEEMKGYVGADFRRFVYTLGLVPEHPGMKLLELGANPYFTTVLLTKFRKANLELANYFDGAQREGAQQVFIEQTGETLNFPFRQFNVENDRFPYEDNSFDVVLFCEIIEHLLSDPVHALAEIKRVLKPGGSLILTTPNVARLENAEKILAGQNIYDPYSGYGPYGRHNREYTETDLRNVLSANGFNIETMFTADVNKQPDSASAGMRRAQLLTQRRSDLGQYIFCRCTINEEAKSLKPNRPDWLYRSMVNTSQPEQADGE